MKLYNTMNKKSRNFPKYETPLDRKAKKAEQLRLRNVREQTDLNNRSQYYDEEDDYEYGDEKNLE
jgi:hypothetical protein